MGPYNGGFPVTYPQFYPQYQQPSMGQGQGGNAQQMMTPPTIHAEIVQIGNRDEAVNFPVGAGQAQMMIMRDDSSIFIKSAFANGQSTIVEYIKKPPEPEKPPVDYVTREEFEERIAELTKKRKKVQEDEQSV